MNGYGSLFPRPRTTDWVDIVLQAYPYSTHYTQGMSYTIKELEPDQQYEAIVLAR